MAFDHSTALHVVHGGVSAWPTQYTDDGDVDHVVVPTADLSAAGMPALSTDRRRAIVEAVDAALAAAKPRGARTAPTADA